MIKMGYGRFPLKTLLAVLITSLSAPGFAEISVLRKPVDMGAYEMAYNTEHQSLLVATTQNHDTKGGVVYELDGKTLAVMHEIKTGNKPFGAAINNKTHTAWFGGSIDGSLTAVDVNSGKVKGVVTLVPQDHHEVKREKPAEGRTAKGGNEQPKVRNDNRPPAPRELQVDELTNTVYVSGVNRNDSVLWIVDGNSMTLNHTLKGLGKLDTGLALDSDNHRLYTSNADGEFITIDTVTHQVISRSKIITDGQEHLLMNISLDTQGHRAFIADNKASIILVVDINTGKVIQQIQAPESLSVIFNPARNQIYAAHRNNGTVSIIDGTTYKVVNTIQLPSHPNSLTLSPAGDAVYVSVKQDVPHGESATSPDDVVRISLN